MTKTYKYLSVVVLGGLAFAGQTYAAVINWGGDFSANTMNVAAEFITMFNDPILLLVGVLCAVIGIGALIGYLKH